MEFSTQVCLRPSNPSDLSIDYNFKPKSEMKLVDSRRLTTNFEIYPKGIRNYTIEWWEDYKIPKKYIWGEKSSERVDTPELTPKQKADWIFLTYLIDDYSPPNINYDDGVTQLSGKQGDILWVTQFPNKNNVIEAYKAEDPDWELGVIDLKHVKFITFG